MVATGVRSAFLLCCFAAAAAGVFAPGAPEKASLHRHGQDRVKPGLEGKEDKCRKYEEGILKCKKEKTTDKINNCASAAPVEELKDACIKECKAKSEEEQEACSKASNGDEVPDCKKTVEELQEKCNKYNGWDWQPEEKSEDAGDQGDVDTRAKGVELGKCSHTDKTAMFELGAGSRQGSFPHSMARCANQAFQIFTGLNATSFGLCMRKETRISQTCAACFAGASASQAFWCGGACMFSWCSQPCLACTWAYRATHLKSCVGFAAPEPQSC